LDKPRWLRRVVSGEDIMGGERPPRRATVARPARYGSFLRSKRAGPLHSPRRLAVLDDLAGGRGLADLRQLHGVSPPFAGRRTPDLLMVEKVPPLGVSS